MCFSVTEDILKPTEKRGNYLFYLCDLKIFEYYKGHGVILWIVLLLHIILILCEMFVCILCPYTAYSYWVCINISRSEIK